MSESSKLKNGLAIILSSPSGGGKSSIAKALVAKDSNLLLSVSATTRNPRPGEIDGINYFFRTREDFLKMIENDELLEYSEVYNNLYGIPKKFVQDSLNQGLGIIFDIDWQGAEKLKRLLKNVLTIFILPPSLEELRKRIEARNQDFPKDIDLRMELADSEIKQAKNYDHVIINGNFLDTVENIYQIIQSASKKTYES